MKQRVVWFVAAMVVAVVLAVMATTPPAPDTATSNPVEPSTQRAFAHVERIAAQPHPTGSTANAVVRDYLVGELEAMGLSVETVSGTLDEAGQAKLDYWRDKSSETPTEFANVIGVLPGADPTLPAVALMAHYDSVWGSPGASDDAAGVASILETVRAIAAAGPVERDIVVVLTDAEELGLVGARQFFGENPLAERIGAIVNLEARGGGGVASMFQTSPGNAEVARVYARTVDHPSTSSLATYIYSVLPNDTDLSAALDRGGYAAFNIAFIGRSGLYHSPLSTPENLDRGSLNQMLGQTHALALALANAATLPQETGDAVFFDAFGLATIVYSPWVGWVMLVLGIGGYALAWWRRDRTERGFVSGVGRMAALILVGGVLLYGLNLVSGAGTGAGYYDRLAAIPKLTTMALLVVLGLAVALWGRGTTGFAQRSGAATLIALLAIAGQAMAPTAAYVIVVPVMLIGIAAAVRSLADDRWGRLAAAIVAALVTGYMLSLGFQVMQGVGPTMPYAAMLPAAIGILCWLPIWPRIPQPQTVAIVLLLGATAVALWVRFDPVPPSVAAYSPLKPG